MFLKLRETTKTLTKMRKIKLGGNYENRNKRNKESDSYRNL